MKKTIIIFLMLLFIPYVAFSGREVTTPNVVVMNTDKAELINANFIWGSIPSGNACHVTYRIWNDTRTEIQSEITYVIEGDDFTSLVFGYGSTMESRLESSIWNDVQLRWSIVP